MADEKTTTTIALSAGQHARIRRLSQPHEANPEDEAGELNIVPFLDIIMNVLMFVLATIPAVFTVSLSTNLPQRPSTPIDLPAGESLHLSLVLVNDGIAMKTLAGNIAPGCEGAGMGVTVPKKNGEYDWATVNSCARKLKGSSPDFKDEDTVQILADPNIPYKAVVGAMDSVRTTTEGDTLFPDVTFAVVQ